MGRESMKTSRVRNYSVNLRKSTVTWMTRDYVFTLIFRWSTFSYVHGKLVSPTVLFSIVAQSISCGGVVLVKSWRWRVNICRNPWLYLCLPFNNLSKRVHKSSMFTNRRINLVTIIVRSLACVLGWVGGVASASQRHKSAMIVFPIHGTDFLVIFKMHSRVQFAHQVFVT